MKRKLEDLSVDDQKQTRKLLFAAAEDAHKNGTTKVFLEGLLTPSEQIMLGRRIWIARMLLEDKTYQEIGERLHVGPNTVMRTELWLQGMLPNYDKEIEKLERVEKEKLHKERIYTAVQNPLSFTALKLRYPLHFLFFPWPKR